MTLTYARVIISVLDSCGEYIMPPLMGFNTVYREH